MNISKKEFKKNRTTNKIKAISNKPRVCVYRSNKHDYVQLLDANNGDCLLSLTSQKIVGKNKLELAKKLGQEFAKKLKAKKITSIAFDRRNHKYHGHVKLIADGLRDQGIKF